VEHLTREVYDFLKNLHTQADATRLWDLLVRYAEALCGGGDKETGYLAVCYVWDRVYLANDLDNDWYKVKTAISNYITKVKRSSRVKMLTVPAEVAANRSHVIRVGRDIGYPTVRIWKMPDGVKKRCLQSYWLNDLTEAEVGREQGISQQAASKHIAPSKPKTGCKPPRYEHRWEPHFDYELCKICGFKKFYRRSAVVIPVNNSEGGFKYAKLRGDYDYE